MQRLWKLYDRTIISVRRNLSAWASPQPRLQLIGNRNRLDHLESGAESMKQSTHIDRFSGEGGNREVVYTDEVIGSIYTQMFPDDPKLKLMDQKRAKLVYLFLVELNGNIPFMVTAKLKLSLKKIGYSDAEIDLMTPTRAKGIVFVHENSHLAE